MYRVSRKKPPKSVAPRSTPTTFATKTGRILKSPSGTIGVGVRASHQKKAATSATESAVSPSVCALPQPASGASDIA